MTTVPRSTVRYEVLGELGQGTFAVVYRVRLEDSDDALVLRSFRGQPEASPIYQDRMRKRFRWGLQHHRSVAHLDGIVGLRMILEDEHAPAAILDHIEGLSLRDIRGTVRERLDVLRRLATTVAVLHDRHLVHRDLKPDNVLVTAGQCPVLLDFDLAARCEGPQPTTWEQAEISIFPASNYHHPAFREAFDRASSDPKFNGHNIRQPAVDVYGLGGILLFILTGKDPGAEYTQTERAVHRASHRRLIAEVGASAADHLLGTALRCLTPRLQDTPSLGELLEALHGFAAASRSRTAGQAVRHWLVGARLHSVADLQRSYARPVLQTLRFRQGLKVVTCGLALLGPLALWYLVGRPPEVRLSLALLANVCFVVSASHLQRAAAEVGPEGASGERTIVGAGLRVSHHANHVAWCLSFAVLVASIVEIPWRFRWSGAADQSPVLARAPAMPTDGLEMAYVEPRSASGGPAVLALWNATAERRYATTFIGPDGAVAGSCDTIVVGTPATAWEVVAQKERLVVPDVIDINEDPNDPELAKRVTEVDSTVLFVRQFSNPVVVKQVVPTAVGLGGLTISHEYEALGGYGPFVFAREQLAELGGGVAGWSSARFHVFDLSALDSSIALYSGDVELGIKRRESFLTAGEFTSLTKIGALLKDPTDNGDGPFKTGSKGELTGYYPTYPEGRPQWTAQFTWPSSRGSGDGYWDTYAKSAFVTAPNLSPQRLKDTSPLRFAAPGAGTPTFRGWSWVQENELAELARRPDCRTAS